MYRSGQQCACVTGIAVGTRSWSRSEQKIQPAGVALVGPERAARRQISSVDLPGQTLISECRRMSYL